MLSRRQKYLQVALNGTLADAHAVIDTLPPSPRILIEAGTPLIKNYGMEAITSLRNWWSERLTGVSPELTETATPASLGGLILTMIKQAQTANSLRLANSTHSGPDHTRILSSVAVGSREISRRTVLDKDRPFQSYIVADLKTMDRAATEVNGAKMAGAAAAVVLGLAPLETINAFIIECEKRGMDSMVDMMNVTEPYKIMRQFKKLPTVVILHRGVDEETYSKDKPLPYQNINKIKGSYNVLISVAGGDTPREIQRAAFNGADIVVVWKDFYQTGADTGKLAAEFLKDIK